MGTRVLFGIIEFVRQLGNRRSWRHGCQRGTIIVRRPLVVATRLLKACCEREYSGVACIALKSLAQPNLRLSLVVGCQSRSHGSLEIACAGVSHRNSLVELECEP